MVPTFTFGREEEELEQDLLGSKNCWVDWKPGEQLDLSKILFTESRRL